MIHNYGPPCFADNSCRSITILDDGILFFKTTYTQGMRKYTDDPSEVVLEVFTEYRNKLNKEDKKLFKFYFDSL